MITLITPDGSLVFSVAEGSVYVDAARRMVHVRAAHGVGAGRGTVMESCPIAEVQFFTSRSEDGASVYFELERYEDDRIELGFMPAGEIARQIARQLESISGRPLSTRVSAPPYHEQDTRRVDYPARKVPVDDLRLDEELVVEEVDLSSLVQEANRPLDAEPTIPIDLEARRAARSKTTRPSSNSINE